MHHHLAASGNLGQVIKRDYPIIAPAYLDQPVLGDTQFVGPLCTPLDTLGRQTALPALQPGDLVCVLQSGAYGLSASPVGFLSHPMPAEVLVDAGRPGSSARREASRCPSSIFSSPSRISSARRNDYARRAFHSRKPVRIMPPNSTRMARI